ncbi:MAG: hypothetical protein K0S24_4222 [Sphingobacterium sp.]|jgi:hypothetical protein|nr:hypothetical protein [Sphingobacterium sp.]
MNERAIPVLSISKNFQQIVMTIGTDKSITVLLP